MTGFMFRSQITFARLLKKIKKNKNKHRNFSFPDSLSFFFLQTGMIAGKTQFSY